MNYLNSNNLMNVCLGATLLGSGGGGDPAILYNNLHYLLEKNGPVRVIRAENLPTNALIVPLALIGAPLISLERIPNNSMFLNLLKAIENENPGRELVLMPAEIGGCNALTPFMLAAQTSLPVLDADLIGRAFPKLQMCKPAILGMNKQRSYLASPFGECITLDTLSIENLEIKAREAVVNFGCNAVIATFLFNTEDQENHLIYGSLSRAQELGQLLQQNRTDLLNLTTTIKAKKINSGLITEACHAIEGGFLTGYAEIKTNTNTLRLFYQNEYLMVIVKDQPDEAVIAESPDIIIVLESKSGRPLTSEALRFGLKVDLFSLPSPAFWEEIEARKQVCLQAFGFTDERGTLYV